MQSKTSSGSNDEKRGGGGGGGGEKGGGGTASSTYAVASPSGVVVADALGANERGKGAATRVAGRGSVRAATAGGKIPGKEEKEAEREEGDEDDVGDDGYDHSHTNTSRSAYDELLEAKDVQNSPLPIPISPGSNLPATNVSSGSLPYGAHRSRPSTSGFLDTLSPPLTSNTDDNESQGQAIEHGNQPQENASAPPASPFHADDQHRSPSPLVQAVPVTSVYHQVAAAELYSPPPKSPTADNAAREGEDDRRPLRQSASSNAAGREQHADVLEIERTRLKWQRYKVFKLLIMLSILVVVVTVPLVIRSQRLAAASSGSSGSGGTTPPCFLSYGDLESAVDDYLAGGTRKDEALQTWGSPIGTWCVSKLTPGSGMDNLFSAIRNPKAAAFNDPLYYWDVGNVVSMLSMFQNATSFNQPLATWNVTRVERMTSMFLGATDFSQNLCNWGTQLGEFTLVHNMFAGTRCVDAGDPVITGTSTGSPPQSFCTPCYT
jgi:hypothetical protein